MFDTMLSVMGVNPRTDLKEFQKVTLHALINLSQNLIIHAKPKTICCVKVAFVKVLLTTLKEKVPAFLTEVW